MTAAPPLLSDLGHVLDAFDLVEIVAYEHSGVRTAELGDDHGPEITALVRREPTLLETRFRLTVTTAEAELSSDVGAVFSASDSVEFAPELIGEFLEQVGVMVVYPYLREGVFTSATRLGVPVPVLNLVKRGQVTFGADHEG